jgi:hypothetical protein
VRKNLVFVGSLIRLSTSFSKFLKKSEIDAIKLWMARWHGNLCFLIPLPSIFLEKRFCHHPNKGAELVVDIYIYS